MITRATIPTEFIDLTSAMLLLQPEPQYIYAQLWKMALAASFQKPSGFGIVPAREIPSGGAGVRPYQDNQLVFEDPVFTKAFVNVPEIGKRPGHTVRLNRPYFRNTTYTEASREIVSGSSISTSAIDIANEQVALTLKRYGGPYDQTNSRVAPFGLERFDSTVSMHDLTGLVGMHMERDFDRTLDSFVANLLDTLPIIWPDGITQDSDISAVDAGPMTFSYLAKIERTLDDLSIPVFPNGRRVGVVTPHALQQLKNDPQFARYAEFHPPVNPILAQAYYKSVGGLDIFKATTVPTVVVANITIDKNQFFGPSVLGSGVGALPRVAFSTDDNYGEQVKLLWLLYGAFRVIDSRFGVSAHSG
jgi:hypothetical protein